MIYAEEAREWFSYNADNGELRWRKKPQFGRAKVGGIAGCVYSPGYYMVKLNEKRYLAHRLIWLYMTGEWPRGEIDHVNGVRRDNRWTNLREVDHRTNAENRRTSTGRHGLLGVFASQGKFRAVITVKDKRHYLGYFTTPELAHAAYVEAKRRLHKGNTL